MHGMLINHFLRSGGYYPYGGASEIAFQMVPGIERAGGKVLARAHVDEILFEDGKACGKVFSFFAEISKYILPSISYQYIYEKQFVYLYLLFGIKSSGVSRIARVYNETFKNFVNIKFKSYTLKRQMKLKCCHCLNRKC